jgi:hypothetical protein
LLYQLIKRVIKYGKNAKENKSYQEKSKNDKVKAENVSEIKLWN